VCCISTAVVTGADAARHRGEHRGDPGHGRGVHIPGHAAAIGGGGAHVDHHGTRADMVRSDQFGLAGRCDQDIRLAADGLQISGP
jgi:hypothetical protein